jgi:hypothetical protein
MFLSEDWLVFVSQQGEFSFDDFFKDLAADALPLFQDDNPQSSDNGQGTFPNGDLQENGVKGGGKLVGVPFVEAEALLPVCRDTRKELVELCYQVPSQTCFFINLIYLFVCDDCCRLLRNACLLMISGMIGLMRRCA